jgi:hypothetical protein
VAPAIYNRVCVFQVSIQEFRRWFLNEVSIWAAYFLLLFLLSFLFSPLGLGWAGGSPSPFLLFFFFSLLSLG